MNDQQKITIAFGAYIKLRRLKAKISADLIASRLGIQKQTYYLYEKGKVPNLSFHTVDKILMLLNCNWENFLEYLRMSAPSPNASTVICQKMTKEDLKNINDLLAIINQFASMSKEQRTAYQAAMNDQQRIIEKLATLVDH